MIASLVYHPEFSFYSENLLPNHFFNKENRYIYAAICNLAQRGVQHIDPYSILQSLQSQEATAKYADEITVAQLNDFFDTSDSLARHTVEDYKLCVDNVIDVIDECWAEIEGRQGSGYAGIPFKFPALNDYATIERGELFIFGAEQKQGKSMMLLNCAVDLLQHDYAVLYLDSELNTRLFTARILAHLTGIE